jgi:hypothetical protein
MPLDVGREERVAALLDQLLHLARRHEHNYKSQEENACRVQEHPHIVFAEATLAGVVGLAQGRGGLRL